MYILHYWHRHATPRPIAFLPMWEYEIMNQYLNFVLFQITLKSITQRGGAPILSV